MAGGATAQLTGELSVSDGCVVVISAEGRVVYLVLWPAASRPEVGASLALEVRDVPGSTGVLTEGTTVTLGGGEVKDEGFVEDLIGAQLPEGCRTGSYWIASGAHP